MRTFRLDRVPLPRSLPTEMEIFAIPEDVELDVEVGCGVGLHPIRHAQRHPERRVVAIEHSRERFTKFAARLSRHPEIPGLRAIHANAISWISHRVPVGRVDRYFFLYPNPYPKRSDRNKRWHAMPFMERVIETLKPGGTLTLATNEEFYWDEARDFYQRIWGLSLELERDVSLSDLPDGKPRTHFEAKYLDRGQRCRELRFRKGTYFGRHH